MRQPDPRHFPATITIPRLAAACGMTRQSMGRRLRESGVVLRQRGGGKKRKHVFVTFTEVLKQAPWLIDEIENWNALIARGRSGAEKNGGE